MIQLIYASAATVPFGQRSLVSLLEQARLANEAVGVSGMLLFEDDTFLQILEGPEAAVLEVYARISRDPRHDRVLMLRRCAIEECTFADWSMGFANGSGGALKKMPGYTKLMSPSYYLSSADATGSKAFSVLARFRDGSFRRAMA